MNVGTVLLAVWLFLTGGEELGWFALSPQMMGILALLAALFIVVGSVGVLSLPVPLVKRRTE